MKIWNMMQKKERPEQGGAAPAAKNELTELVFILDRSGSMSG